MNSNSFKLSYIWDGLFVGIVGGGASVLYRLLIIRTDVIREYIYSFIKDGNILFILGIFLLSSFIIARLLQWSPLSGGSGIPQIRGEILGKFSMSSYRVLISKLIGGSLASVAGMSLGREGPSIQIGGACGKLIGRYLKKDSDEIKSMISAGATAGLSAAFNAPLAASMFSIEEIHKKFSHEILIPILTAAVTANFISFNIVGHDTAFSFKVNEVLPLHYIWIVVFIGIISGIGGVVFNMGLLKSQSIFSKLKVPLWLKIFIAMTITIPFGLYSMDLLGGGHNFAELIAKNNYTFKALIILLILKTLLTWISYGSGTQGGIFLPVLVIGCALGEVVFFFFYRFFPLEAYYVNFVILGMAGILTSVVRAPILSILLVSEMTGNSPMLLTIIIVSIISFVTAELMKNDPIYESLLERLYERFNIQ